MKSLSKADIKKKATSLLRLFRKSNWSLSLMMDAVEAIIGGNCYYCDTKLTIKNISADHKQPASLGGDNSIQNTRLICNPCNRAKGELTEAQYTNLLKFLDDDELMKVYVIRKLKAGGFMYFKR